MAARKPVHAVNWTVILFLAGLAITTMTTLAAFYYGTNATLAKHDEQFKKLGEDFRAFGETSKVNFDKWLSINRDEREKAERTAKEDREAREKMRDGFTSLINQLTTNTVGTKIQVEAITKQLDAVTTKIDSISTIQQENRAIRQQQVLAPLAPKGTTEKRDHLTLPSSR